MKPTRTVKTADTLISVITELQKMDGAGVTELASQLEMAKSTVHDHLATLHEHGYVVKDNNKYHLGLRFLDHGTHARERLSLKSTVTPCIRRLAEDTGETVWFVTEEEGQVVYLYRAIGDRGIDLVCRAGVRTDIHTNAAGKAILATYSNDEVRKITKERGLTEKTPNTTTDIEMLLEELEEIRNEGIAMTSEEKQLGIASVGTDVTVSGKTHGAVTVSAPEQRLTAALLEETTSRLRSTVNEMELRLDHEVCSE